MKLSSLVVRSCIGLFLLAATTGAQFVTPAISSIPSRKSFAPGNLVVNGSNLGLITQVKLDGVSVPIIRISSTRLVAGPLAPQDPGFATVELIFNRGTLVGTLELTPTLTASRRGIRVTSTIHNGDVGAYVLLFSYTRLPALAVDAGIYYGRWIPADSAVLSTGVFVDNNPIVTVSQLPIEVGLIGAPLDLQALCTVGADAVQSYTNLATVPGFGRHQ